jgi:DNA-binding response OmpR family regulator
MGLKILIVDDEPHIRMLLEQTLEGLEEQGVELLTASNGEAALDLVETELPQLVFLDVMMPKMNGFDLCDQVKHQLGLGQIYIILLTAKGQEVDKQKGQEVGADLYLTKPFDPDLVLATAMDILGLNPLELNEGKLP